MTPSTTPAKRRSVLKRSLSGRSARLLMRMLAPTQKARSLQFAALGAPSDRVVFLGDSISQDGLWDEWFPGVPVANRGIGGETSAQVLKRLDAAIQDPRAVFLLIGTNDLSLARPESEILDDVRSMLLEIERQAPGTPVHVQSVMPRAAEFAAEVASLNIGLDRLAGEAPTVSYVDLWPALSDAAGALRAEYTLDKLHLNGDGYRAWTAVLRPLVEVYG